MSELKACPFCGHEADDSDGFVCCSNCECTASGLVAYPHQWNRRTPDRAALVEVARRAMAGRHYCVDTACAECLKDANEIVDEYLAEQAEQAGKEAPHE